MSKAIVIFGSTTGNTEKLAGAVARGLRNAGLEVVLKNVSDTEPTELLDYDLLFLGSSTWANGELQDDFIGFEENMADLDLTGKNAAVFGCGESYLPKFCEAVNILERRLNKCGAELIAEGYKVDGEVAHELGRISTWAGGVVR